MVDPRLIRIKDTENSRYVVGGAELCGAHAGTNRSSIV